MKLTEQQKKDNLDALDALMNGFAVEFKNSEGYWRHTNTVDKDVHRIQPREHQAWQEFKEKREHEKNYPKGDPREVVERAWRRGEEVEYYVPENKLWFRKLYTGINDETTYRLKDRSLVEKYSQEPKFTTDDGVEVYIRDKVIPVTQDCTLNAVANNRGVTVISNINSGLKYFFHKEEAIKYIQQRDSNKIDWSIVNDTDWFICELLYNRGRWISKGNIINKNIDDAIHIKIDASYTSFNTSDFLEEKESFKSLRKATKEEVIEHVYKNYPQLILDNFTDFWVGQKVWHRTLGMIEVNLVDAGKVHTVVNGRFKALLIEVRGQQMIFPHEMKLVRAK